MKKITSDFPSSKLLPNRSKGVHWGQISGLRKASRDKAKLTAEKAGLAQLEPSGTVVFLIYPPDKRKRDVDGILSALKSTIDGLFDIIPEDDNILRCMVPIRMDADKDNPRVEIVFFEKTDDNEEVVRWLLNVLP